MINLANILTGTRILLIPLYLWLFAQKRWDTTLGALLVFIFAAVTDFYDGKLARERREVTKIGKFMDPLADKFLVLGALAQFWVMGLVNMWLVGIIILRDVWVTLLRIIAIQRGTELKTSADAKLKTTIQLTVIITIIVFTCWRFIALKLGFTGHIVNIHLYRIFFNGFLLVAVIFTVYSWFKYIVSKSPA